MKKNEENMKESAKSVKEMGRRRICGKSLKWKCFHTTAAPI